MRAIIGMHSTVLGQGVAGCRMWNYANEQEALNDVLRLSKGMTYKASMTGLNWGGGKVDSIFRQKNRGLKVRRQKGLIVRYD